MSGRIVRTFGFPKISGYLVFGVLVGPGVIGLIHKSDLPQLQLVNDLAIAMIALVAGGEIKFAMVRRSWRAISMVVLGQTLFLVVGIGKPTDAVDDAPLGITTALAIVMGVVFMASKIGDAVVIPNKS